MPTWNGKLGEAISLAADVHKFQTDKSGKAYILHPLSVMQRATDYYLGVSDGWQLEMVQIVAVFHDVLEDIDEEHGWAKSRLASRIYHEFGNDVSSGVENLTKWEGTLKETYDEYIERVGSSWVSRIVKIADLTDNLDGFRLPTGDIGEKDFERWDKYHRALVKLMGKEVGVRR